MFKELLELYAFVDQTVATLRERFPDEVACGKGCADCCSAAFDVSFIEGLAILDFFHTLPEDNRHGILARSKTAFKEWQAMLAAAADPARARIRCPLLTAENTCSAYPARPLNCRTYGTPTVIHGAAHVCGLSRFDMGQSYPTIQLAPLQQSLFDYSCRVGGEEQGRRRFPIAAVLLDPGPFSSILDRGKELKA